MKMQSKRISPLMMCVVKNKKHVGESKVLLQQWLTFVAPGSEEKSQGQKIWLAHLVQGLCGDSVVVFADTAVMA